MTYSIPTLRRAATVALLSAATVLSAASAPAAPTAARSDQPLLATPDQVEAEQTLIELLKDPELKAAQQRVRQQLAQSAIGQTRDGAARIDEVVAQWTNSLAFKELIAGRQTPAILWGTDDTPRTWLGHTLGGVGTSGDNPDHIYRSSSVDGGGRYEITGKFDPARRPAQFVLSFHATQIENSAVAGNGADFKQLSLLTDKDIAVSPDGSFRVTLGGDAPAGGGNHVALVPGTVGIGIRDVLSDWNQIPARLTIKRQDTDTSVPLDKQGVRKRVIEKLEGYVKFWSRYPETWFGGLKPNAISGPVPREGGWGYLAGLRFQLQPDEAILVTTANGGAQYTGIQVVDPWMIAPNGKQHLTSFNASQAKPNADGTYSFVITPRDPGVVNWLDTGGVHDGFAVLRWQNLPRGTPGEGLLRDFRVIKLADAAKLQGVALSNPSDRHVQLSQRAAGYANRTR